MKTKFVLVSEVPTKEVERTLYIVAEEKVNNINLVITDGINRRPLVGLRNYNGKLAVVRWMSCNRHFEDVVEVDSAGCTLDIFSKDK